VTEEEKLAVWGRAMAQLAHDIGSGSGRGKAYGTDRELRFRLFPLLPYVDLSHFSFSLFGNFLRIDIRLLGSFGLEDYAVEVESLIQNQVFFLCMIVPVLKRNDLIPYVLITDPPFLDSEPESNLERTLRRYLGRLGTPRRFRAS